MRRRPTGVGRVGTALLGLALLGGAMAGWAPAAGGAPNAGPGPPAAVAGQGAGPAMSLASQTPVVGPDGDFAIRLRIPATDDRSNWELALTAYPAVPTRSAFIETLRDRTSASPLVATQVFPLSTLPPDPHGEVTIPLRFQGRLSLGRTDGVFPLRVDLRQRGAGRLLRRLTTHLVYLPVPPAQEKLGMSLVVPVHAAAGLPAKGARKLRAVDELSGVPAALDAVRSIPATLAPTPETLATISAGTEEKASTLLKGLQQRASAMTVLSAAYVPTSLPTLLANGLGRDAVTQVGRGTDVVVEGLHVRPDGRTWLALDPLDEAALAMLVGRGTDRVITSESNLKPVSGQKLTLTQPFVLSSGGRRVEAVAADAGLAAHFDNQLDPVLAANQLLADLAVIYLDQPGTERRSVAAVAPRAWRADRQFLETLVAGLATNPIVEPLSLDAMFASSVPTGSGQRGGLVRKLNSAPGGGVADLAADLRVTRSRLDALGSMLGPSAGSYAQLEERLLIAESAELRTKSQRQAYVDAVARGIDTQTSAIRMPQGRSITLTARRGEIPVTFQNLTGAPARVVVKLQSDKLLFPGGNTHMLDLARRNTTERLTVVSRTSGAFPVRITLESPDGNLVIGRTRLTIRSTAASGVGLAVSLGAALFLALWWGRHALRGRRARRPGRLGRAHRLVTP